MPLSLHLPDFLGQRGTIIDVRSPSEFKQGHLPHSHSLPLFDDDERALIGTAYKRKSRIEAIDLGLSILAEKIEVWINRAELLDSKQINVLCWRGGMRSGFAAQLLESCGYQSSTLIGGYKTFRRRVLATWNGLPSTKIKLFVVGGLTGSGKTKILSALKKLGEQVLDLEDLAQHRGSAFGHIGLSQQPTQEQFENQLADEWLKFDLTQPIWIEDESRLIGKCHLPSKLYEMMQQAPLFYLECSEEERLQNLLQLYGSASRETLINATQCLMRRLGTQLTSQIIELIQSGDLLNATKHLMIYYDKTYSHQLKKRTSPIHRFESPDEEEVRRLCRKQEWFR